MRAWRVTRPGPVQERPLELLECPAPEPGPKEIRVKISTCGVCRTDLHIAEGDLPARRPQVIPGHEAVGRVDALGEGAVRFEIGARVGIAWLRHTCGTCRYCRRGDENLCPQSRYTGWDADGGYAEQAVVDEDFAYALPDAGDDVTTAPLLCAGIIGYRALRRARLPEGGRLGIYGFGGSAHIAAQIALHEGATLYVMTRSFAARELASEIGARWAGGARDVPPERLDAAIVFAPVGDLVPVALRAVGSGGTVAVAGIHLSDIPALRYDSDLFMERTLTSVTANTRRDGEEFLELAARAGVRVTTTPFELGQADLALAALAGDDINGAAVLRM